MPDFQRGRKNGSGGPDIDYGIEIEVEMEGVGLDDFAQVPGKMYREVTEGWVRKGTVGIKSGFKALGQLFTGHPIDAYHTVVAAGDELDITVPEEERFPRKWKREE